MGDLISRALLCGLGLASLTKDAIQKTVEDLVNQSKLSEEEGRKLVRELHQRSEKAKKSLEKNVNSAVHTIFEHLDLPAVITDRLKGASAPAKHARKARRTRAAKKKSTAH